MEVRQEDRWFIETLQFYKVGMVINMTRNGYKSFSFNSVPSFDDASTSKTQYTPSKKGPPCKNLLSEGR